MSASMLSFVYFGIRRRTENNQIALIIIEHFGIAIFEIRLLFIFDAAIFFDKIWTKNKLTWTRPQ